MGNVPIAVALAIAEAVLHVQGQDVTITMTVIGKQRTTTFGHSTGVIIVRHYRYIKKEKQENMLSEIIHRLVHVGVHTAIQAWEAEKKKKEQEAKKKKKRSFF